MQTIIEDLGPKFERASGHKLVTTYATGIRFIKRSQSLGFSLDEVQTLLSLDDGQSCGDAKAIGEHKLADIRQRIKTLKALEIALQQLVAQCELSKRNVSCPLINTLMRAAEPSSS